MEARVSGFLIPFEPNYNPPPLPVDFWQLANQIFLEFYPNIFLKSAGTRVIEYTILGGFPNEPTGFQLLLFTLTQFSLASSALALRQDKVQNNQVS